MYSLLVSRVAFVMVLTQQFRRMIHDDPSDTGCCRGTGIMCFAEGFSLEGSNSIKKNYFGDEGHHKQQKKIGNDMVHDDDATRLLLSTQLEIMSVALQTAGELTSDMASKLPNWYSSKEGLTGESPAVFGSCGMSFTQAGESIAPRPPFERTLATSTAQSKQPNRLRVQFQNLSSDLASAACALDPIGISANLDLVCEALDGLVGDNPQPQHCDQVVQALCDCGQDLQDYGDLLCTEDSKSYHDETSAGRILSNAGQEIRNAGNAFSIIPFDVLRQQLQQEGMV